MSYIVFGGLYPMFAIPTSVKNPFERVILEKKWQLLTTLIKSRNVNELTSVHSIPLIFFLRNSNGADVNRIVTLFLKRFSEIENIYVDDNGTHRESALIEIIGKESVQILLDYNAHINFQGDGGETALHRAVIMNDVPNIKILLERGANADIPRDIDKMTARDLCRIQELMFPILFRQHSH